MVLAGLAAVLTLAPPGDGSAAPARPLFEDKVKAAFLYNFAKFIEWPAEVFGGPSEPLIIEVIGSSEFAETLRRTVEGKTAQGRSFQVRLTRAPGDTRSGHILFVSQEAERILSRVIESRPSAPVLIVGESTGVAERGATINFYLEENNVRFEINPAAAERARLRISSKLLSLARIVGSPRDGGR